jgi:Protein of unknown function (DUF4127)
VSARGRRSPGVEVVYSAPAYRRITPRYEGQALDLTVTSHIETTGCRHVEAAEDPRQGTPDLRLIVHNSRGEQREAPYQEPYPLSELDGVFGALEGAEAAGVPCAVADVRYSNGADRTLVGRLLAAPRASGVQAYGGWNTMSNTLGMALAQALVAPPPQGGAGSAAERANRDFLILRFLDDWGYQTIVRQRLAQEVLPRFAGVGPSDIGPAYTACAEAARAWLEESCVPPVARSFGVPIALGPVGFPWNRLFHVSLEIHVG